MKLALEKLALLIFVHEICPVGVLNEEVRIEAGREIFEHALDMESDTSLANTPAHYRRIEEKTWGPTEPLAKRTADVLGYPANSSSPPGTTQRYGDMLARFDRELMHEVRSRIRKGLIVEFDEIENAGDVGKIEREFKVFECQGAC